MNQQSPYDYRRLAGCDAAQSTDIVNAVSHIFSNSFGTNPQTGQPYTLGPKTTRKRLDRTDHVFTAQHKANGFIGYLYARRIPYSQGAVGWIDSLAVLPAHRRKGVASSLVKKLTLATPDCRWFGCATPNPIAALVITNVVRGKTYIGDCNPPAEVVSVINEIRPQCPDLSGVEFNPRTLLVRTTFTPVSIDDTKEWNPPHPSEPPPWWSSLTNLPSEYEALLLIDSAFPLHADSGQL
jgi:GNAT superfamily N-acetyltransferase